MTEYERLLLAKQIQALQAQEYAQSVSGGAMGGMSQGGPMQGAPMAAPPGPAPTPQQSGVPRPQQQGPNLSGYGQALRGFMGSGGGEASAASLAQAGQGLGGTQTGALIADPFAGVAGSSAASGGAAGGSAGAGAGASGGGGMLAAAGPWAALAAAVIGNEMAAKDAGRRSDDDGEYAKDLLTGKVLEQDLEYYGDKIGGPVGKSVEVIGEMGNPSGAWRNIKKLFKPWELF